MGKRVVAIDLDPQANLTSAFLPEEQLESLWDSEWASNAADTIYKCIRPLAQVGDFREPVTKQINPRLSLVPGDLGLAGVEDRLSEEGPKSVYSGELYRPLRILTAIWQVSQLAAREHNDDLILADVGPNRGAINGPHSSDRITSSFLCSRSIFAAGSSESWTDGRMAD